MATHPVNASPAKRKEKRVEEKAGTSAQAQQDEEIKNKFSTPTPINPSIFWSLSQATGVGAQNLHLWPPRDSHLSSSLRHCNNRVSSLQHNCPLCCAAKHQQSLFLAPFPSIRSQHRPTAATNFSLPSQPQGSQSSAKTDCACSHFTTAPRASTSSAHV